MMSQAKLLKFKTYPANLLFREFFNFEANYLHQEELPTFPKELRLDTSEFKKGFQKISAFAISRYLLTDLTNLRPRRIIRSLISLPQQLLSAISEARSNF